MIPRLINIEIVDSLNHSGKVIGVFGARRTGKTFLMNTIRKDIKNKKVLMVQGDDLDAAEILSSQRLSILQRFIKGYDYLFIDEAQKIRSIGENLKLLVDNFPSLHILITGSSALDLRRKTGEPLTGRNKYFNLYPIAQVELEEDYLTMKKNLENRLIFGSYPEVILSKNNKEKIELLISLRDSYLLKDILELNNEKDGVFILQLLRLIAFQIGNDISFSELASSLNVNKKTVMRYLDLLEKSYVLFSLQGFSKNMRSEYSKTPRYFFWDNGIRNTVISNFNGLTTRDDIGKLWENYCISERLKIIHYKREVANHYFWRTYDQKEINLIEEKDGVLHAFEFKWKNSKAKVPKQFILNYPGSSYSIINQDNYQDFIL